MTASTDREFERKTGSPEAPCDDAGARKLVDDLADRVASVRKEFLSFVALKATRIKLSLAESGLRVVLIVLAIAVAITVLVTSVIFVFTGISGWIGDATARPWLGSLLAGVFGIIIIAAGVLSMKAAIRRRIIRSLAERRDA